VSAISLPVSAHSGKRAARLFILPFVTGTLAAFVMLGVYILILTVFQDFSHAMQQAAQDWLWVGLVALGFGTQIGLYTYLRVIIHAAKAAGATVMAGTGTGTSTLGMIACCAHHLTDFAPLVGLMGASGLSGAIGFFTELKYAFIALGLGMNAIGIIVTLRTIRRSKAHLDAMAMAATETAPACH
jgi:hypothetical protein